MPYRPDRPFPAVSASYSRRFCLISLSMASSRESWVRVRRRRSVFRAVVASRETACPESRRPGSLSHRLVGRLVRADEPAGGTASDAVSNEIVIVGGGYRRPNLPVRAFRREKKR